MIDAAVFSGESASVDRGGSGANLETSELRWFALGRPPRDVMAWFSAVGTAGTLEHRCDTYHVNVRHDVGLKRRFGWIPEVKVRGQSNAPPATRNGWISSRSSEDYLLRVGFFRWRMGDIGFRRRFRSLSEPDPKEGTVSENSTRPVPTAPTTMQRWFPIGVWIKGYDWRASASADLIAAVSVVALLVPESMGYASVAGVPSQIGLYAAPLAVVFYAMFGGSRLLGFAAATQVAPSRRAQLARPLTEHHEPTGRSLRRSTTRPGHRRHRREIVRTDVDLMGCGHDRSGDE